MVQIQRIARGFLQRRAFARLVERKKEEAIMAVKLAKMQKQLEETKRREEEVRRKEAAEEAKRTEEEKMQRMEEEKRRMEQELRELKMEKELQELRDQVSQQRSQQVQSPPPDVRCTSPNSLASESQVQVVEVVKYVEKEVKAELSAEQKALMEESGRIIEFLRAENLRLKRKNDQQRRDFATLKENNQRLMEANSSAGSSFQSLNQHAKQLNATNQKLLKTVAQYRNRVSKLHSDMKNRQTHYRDLSKAYQAESDARVYYEKTLLEIVDIVSEKKCDRAIHEFVMQKAVECATVSQKATRRAAAELDDETEAESSSYDDQM